MKQFYLIVLSVLLFNFGFANPVITVVQNNGSWKSSATWDKNRKPTDGDTVVVPAGKTIIVNSWETLNNVDIKVFGTLKLAGLFTGLGLNSSSKIKLYDGAMIQATWDYVQYITIGSTYLFYEGRVTGPLLGTSAGFSSFTPLPVKFESFTVTRNNSDVLIQWSTSQEINADMYQIERSLDGSNWNTIAYVSAVGNSSAASNYSFTDRNLSAKIAYYRIKEADIEGNTSFTAVKWIKMETASATSDIRIAASQNKVILQFPRQVRGSLMVRFVSLNGQVMDQQAISNAAGQVVLNSKLSGNYIISVSNGQDINTAKQVIL